MKKALLVLLTVILLCSISAAVFAQETALKITQQPVSVSVPNGETATVSFEAQGEGLYYRWYFKNKGDTAFYPAYSFTGNTYEIKMNEERDGREVYCIVSDKSGNRVKTDTVTLSMTKSTLQITNQPSSVCVADGETATVSFTVEGDGLKFQWYFKNKGDTTFYPTASFKSNTYEVEMNATRDGRELYCVVTDKYGDRIQTNTVTIEADSTLQITKQPTSVFLTAYGETASVSFTAEGAGLKFQWYFKNKGNNIFYPTSSFDGNTYEVEMNDARNGRELYCVVTDKYGNRSQTDIVTIGVESSMRITAQPTSVVVANGETASVSFQVEGEALTYQWYYKNKDSSNFYPSYSFDGNTYEVEMNKARDGRQLYCVVTDKYGTTLQTNTVIITTNEADIEAVTPPESKPCTEHRWKLDSIIKVYEDEHLADAIYQCIYCDETKTEEGLDYWTGPLK